MSDYSLLKQLPFEQPAYTRVTDLRNWNPDVKLVALDESNMSSITSHLVLMKFQIFFCCYGFEKDCLKFISFSMKLSVNKFDVRPKQ